jgi:hypothetical protein
MTQPVPAMPASAVPAPAIVDGVDIGALAAAVRSCAGVQDLYAGVPEAVATYLPGQRISGVRIASDHVVISVRGQWGVPAGQLAGQVRAAVGGLVGPRRVDIVVADLADAAAVPAARPAAGERGGEVGSWTSGNGPGGSSSGPITPTTAAIPPPSSTA